MDFLTTKFWSFVLVDLLRGNDVKMSSKFCVQKNTALHPVSKREMGLGRRSAVVTAMLGVQNSVVTFDAEKGAHDIFPTHPEADSVLRFHTANWKSPCMNR